VGRRENWLFDRSSTLRLVRELMDGGNEVRELEPTLRVIRLVSTSSSSRREVIDKPLMLRMYRPLNRAKDPGAMDENLFKFKFSWAQVLTDDGE